MTGSEDTPAVFLDPELVRTTMKYSLPPMTVVYAPQYNKAPKYQ